MATFDLSRNNASSENRQFHGNNSENTIREICLKNGILTSTLLTMCFVAICVSTHGLEIAQLSIANLFFLAFGVYFALQNFSPNGKGESLDYFEGFKVGLYTTLIAVGIHVLAILIYLSFDPSILSQIKENSIWRFHLNPIIVAGGVLFEELASGLIITYCLMQYFKKN